MTLNFILKTFFLIFGINNKYKNEWNGIKVEKNYLSKMLIDGIILS